MHRTHSITKLLVILLFLISNTALSAEPKADDILGFWLSQSKRGVIEIYRNKNQYEGKIVWVKDIWEGDNKVKLDVKNPDHNLRKRKLMSLINLQGFRYKNNQWKKGQVYDPAKGKTYSSYISMPDINTLKLRGYIGVALFGRTSTMIRQRSAIPDQYQQ
jgi:uncharacterized protein (DUF2147 family)